MRLPAVRSDEDCRRLIAALERPILRGCFALMYAYGLRIAEAITLPVSAVDSKQVVLRVIGKGNKEWGERGQPRAKGAAHGLNYGPLPGRTTAVLEASPIPPSEGTLCLSKRFRPAIWGAFPVQAPESAPETWA